MRWFVKKMFYSCMIFRSFKNRLKSNLPGDALDFETVRGGTFLFKDSCFQSDGGRPRTGVIMSRHLRFVARTVMVQDGNIDAAYKTLNR